MGDNSDNSVTEAQAILAVAGSPSWIEPHPLPILQPSSNGEALAVHVLNILSSKMKELNGAGPTCILCDQIFCVVAWSVDTRYQNALLSPSQTAFRSKLLAEALALAKKLVSALDSATTSSSTNDKSVNLTRQAALITYRHLMGLERYAAGKTSVVLILAYMNMAKLLKKYSGCILGQLGKGESGLLLQRISGYVEDLGSELEKQLSQTQPGLQAITNTAKLLANFSQRLTVLTSWLAPECLNGEACAAARILAGAVAKIHPLSRPQVENGLSTDTDQHSIHTLISETGTKLLEVAVQVHALPRGCKRLGEGGVCQCYASGAPRHEFGMLLGSTSELKGSESNIGSALVCSRLLAHTPTLKPDVCITCIENTLENIYAQSWAKFTSSEQLSGSTDKYIPIIKELGDGIGQYMCMLAATCIADVQVYIVRGCTHPHPLIREIWLQSACILYRNASEELREVLLDTLISVCADSSCTSYGSKALSKASVRVASALLENGNSKSAVLLAVVARYLIKNVLKAELVGVFLSAGGSLEKAIGPSIEKLNARRVSDIPEGTAVHALECLHVVIMHEDVKQSDKTTLENFALSLISDLTNTYTRALISNDKTSEALVRLFAGASDSTLQQNTSQVLKLIREIMNRPSLPTNATLVIMAQLMKRVVCAVHGMKCDGEVLQETCRKVFPACLSSSSSVVVNAGADALEGILQIGMDNTTTSFFVQLVPQEKLAYFKERLARRAQGTSTSVPGDNLEVEKLASLCARWASYNQVADAPNNANRAILLKEGDSLQQLIDACIHASKNSSSTGGGTRIRSLVYMPNERSTKIILE